MAIAAYNQSSYMELGPVADGRASNADQQKPQPLSAVAQQAYDRYGVLDPIKLDLMVRGIFITREDAAALPHRITIDGCAESKSVHASHHQRPLMSRAARPSPVTGAPSAASSARTDVSAVPSDHGKWADGATELIIKMRAERVGFRYIAERFPGKNQKAVQEKFYKSIKDARDTRWKRLYEELRAQHDGNMAYTGTFENPIEISDEDTVVNPTEISSETLSESTIAEPDENKIETVERIDNTMLVEDVKTVM